MNRRTPKEPFTLRVWWDQMVLLFLNQGTLRDTTDLNTIKLMQMGQMIRRIALWAAIGAAVGGLLGFLMGAFAPGMYVNWFDEEYVARVGAVWLGVTLGVQQGMGVGALVGVVTIALPWLNRKTATQIKVSASYNSATNSVKIENKGRVPILVSGVWATREIDCCAVFDQPLLISEGTKTIADVQWRNNDGEQVEPPKSATLAVFATAPTISS